MARDSPHLVGSTLGGAFLLTRVIGSGAMGHVYAADGQDGLKAAVKVLHAGAARDRALVARFEREATIAARIKSPHVASVLGAGRDRGRLWIAFELLSGEGLDTRLRREWYLSFTELEPIMDDVLSGLVDAHGAEVVHRDIKPANLFVELLGDAEQRGRDGAAPDSPGRGRNLQEPAERTRILDFGISKLRSHRDAGGELSLTAFDATLGSFAYMAPEQVRGSARVDARADLYALGAVAFRALTGRLPFEGSTPATVAALKLDRNPPELSEVTGVRWPPSIESFLARMMARDRDERFTSATEALLTWRELRAQMGGAPAIRTAPPHEHPREDPQDATELTLHDGPHDPGG